MSDTQETKPAKKSAMMGLVKAVAVIATLVVVEVVAAGFLIPNAQQTKILAEELAAAKQGDDAGPAASVDPAADMNEEEEVVEVEIGPFSVTQYNPETDKTTNIDFELYATVLAEEESEFYDRFDANRNRVREQVQMTLFGAKATDLVADIELIKRRILEKTNHALGRPLVRQVLLTRLNFVER